MPAERTPTKSVKAPHSSFQPKTPTRTNPRRKASDKAKAAPPASNCILTDAQYADIDNSGDESHYTTYAEMVANYYRVDAQRQEVSKQLAVQTTMAEEMTTQLASAKEELAILQGEKDDEANAVQQAQITQLLNDLNDVQSEREARTQERDDLAANAQRLQPVCILLCIALRSG
ncbi:hypothetical protein DXG01_005548 [Tephrocybe rancida]|nr:hypothetical protein DXG01_005548 [Tephrocybe rancida]